MIIEALDETLVVEAAAGTGKTTELVNRILRVLATGRADVREIVAVTFTEKAAGELKLRLRQELEVARAVVTDVAVAERLEAAVQNLEEAHVSTIHGFCADLLRERPVEARVDPLFRVLTEGQSERLFSEAFTAWFQQQLENPPEGVRRSLRRASRGSRPGEVDEDGPVERLRRAGWDLVEWRDFEAPWTREPFDRGEAIRRVVGLVHELGDLSRKPSYAGDNLFVDTAPVRRLSDELRRAAPRRAGRPEGRPLQSAADVGADLRVGPRESAADVGTDLPASAKASARPSRSAPTAREGWQVGPPAEEQRSAEDDDALESALIELRRNRDFRRARKGSGLTFGPGVTRAQVLAARDALTQALDDLQLHADADLAALLHGELLACVAGYEALKAKAGALDFVDLLLRARDLVRDDEGVRRHFQQRFRRIFVDEFQDTDPLQAELLLLLAAEDPLETRWQNVRPVAGKLFIVGDPKQSIYRFRRADVEIYRRVCQQLIEAGATRVLLETSFRAVPNIQRLVNTAFRDVMDGDGPALQAPYVALAPDRAEYPAQPSVVVLPVPRPYAQRYVGAKAIEESLPDAVGAYVEWLQRRSGWKVTERRQPGKRVDIEPRHICILFRRFLSYGRDMTRPYVEALEARGLRHLLVGGKAFHDREEIEALRAALMAVEWPDDQLSVFATLRGPLFALGDEELLEYHHRFGGPFHPFRVPAPLPSHLESVGEALTLLRRLHECRNRQPVAQTIAELVDATRAHAGFVLRPGGEQALANVLHVAELARQYELDGGMSFRGFVDTLQRAAEGGQAAEAPILEEGSDGVRLMTVHKAKGLEFPVVILADITARLTPNEASRHIDPDRRLCALRIGGWSPIDLVRQQALELLREQKEGERVAYVAATRARDLLVVPAVGDVQYEGGWVSPLNAAIYPDENVRRVHKTARGCPSFKSRDSVLERPDNDPFTRLTVCPGEHGFPYGDAAYSVVWWSPEPDVLPLGAQAPFGLRRDDLIVKDVPAPLLRAHLDAYHGWRATRQAAIASAAAPTLEVLTVSEAIARVDLSVIAGAEVTIESMEGASERLGGVRYGTLVHAMLADVPLAAPAARELIERLAVAHGRVLGATVEEVDAARDTVQRVLAHPLIARAARASADGRCHRETSVTYRLDSGALIEGVVDLAFDEPDGYTVVDFKTDRELEGSLDRYRLQVQVYAAAIAAATGRRARAVLMRV